MGKNKFLDFNNKNKIERENFNIFAYYFVILVKAGTYIRVKSMNPGFRRNDLLSRYLIYITYLLSILMISFLMSCSLPRIIVLDDPLSPEEHLNLGVTYEKNGEFDNALKEYNIASKKIALAYLYMGNIYFQKKAYESAEASYKKAIKEDPENADAYNNLAWLFYVRKENLGEAEALALKAIGLNHSKINKINIYQDTLEKIKSLKNIE
jgi:tetratricopeptide (TPR) repeat protein